MVHTWTVTFSSDLLLAYIWFTYHWCGKSNMWSALE